MMDTSSSEDDDLYQDVGHMGSSVIVSRGSGGVSAQQARCDDSVECGYNVAARTSSTGQPGVIGRFCR